MRVLVLCHGSVNRSPFVAAIIAHHRPDWRVHCAGLKTTVGRPATPKAKTAAARIGLDLSYHRSQPMTRDLFDWADVVLYMDSGNEKRLIEQVGEAAVRRKAELLASYGSLRRLPDPNYTSDPELLRQYFGMAELCTMKFLEAHP